MTEAQNKTRRRHSAELKQQILAECAQPGASVASVALSHGINANVVHKWRRLAHAPSTDVQVPTFVPVTLPAPSCAPAPDIRIELRRVLNRGEAVNALKRAIYTGRISPAQAKRVDEM